MKKYLHALYGCPPYNRTVKELKLASSYEKQTGISTYNRTVKELKLSLKSQMAFCHLTYNRTVKELKCIYEDLFIKGFQLIIVP